VSKIPFFTQWGTNSTTAEKKRGGLVYQGPFIQKKNSKMFEILREISSAHGSKVGIILHDFKQNSAKQKQLTCREERQCRLNVGEIGPRVRHVSRYQSFPNCSLETAIFDGTLMPATSVDANVDASNQQR